MRSRPVAARATRTALIVASVPELTNRTRSIDGHQRAHALGEVHFERARRAEARAIARGGGERLDEAARRMPVDERPPRHHVVDEHVAVDVLDARARARGG